MQSAKKSILHILEKLPDDASYDDILYEIQLNKSIDMGIQDFKEGNVFSKEEALKRLQKWLE